MRSKVSSGGNGEIYRCIFVLYGPELFHRSHLPCVLRTNSFYWNIIGASPYNIVAIVLFLLLGTTCSIVVAFDGKLLSRICNGKQFIPGSIYDDAFVIVMNGLKSQTAESPLLDYYCQVTRVESFGLGYITFYGHGVCTENLDRKDCHDCIEYAAKEMFDECTHSLGAQIQLMDCRLRYENYKFTNDH